MPVNNQLLHTICRSRLIDRNLIAKYIPHKANKRPSRALDVLLIVYCHPNKTMSYIKALQHNKSDTISDHVNSLVQLGYLSKKNRQRFVPQINCWKGEFVYNVTKHGQDVLNAVFGSVGEGKY